LGGIQPAIFREFQTDENNSNGFMDRMLFCNPNKKAQYPSREQINPKLLNDYRDVIFMIKRRVDSTVDLKDNTINPRIIGLSKEASELKHKSQCDLVDLQNSDNEIHYYRGMYAKQATYIPRFALLIEFLDGVIDGVEPNEVSLSSYQKAVKLSNYIIKMAKINKSENITNHKIKQLVDSLKGKTNREKVIEINKVFPKETKKQIAEILEVTPKTVYKYLKENKKK